MRVLLPILLVLALASCGERFDTDQQRLCRQAIPALNDPAASVTIDGPTTSSFPGALRILYRVETRPGQYRQRSIDCLFSRSEQGLERGALNGIASDGRPMSDASFYLLRRFYLEDRQDPPSDPGAPALTGLPEIPASLAYGLQQGLAMLPAAAIYMLLAAAYALIYGLTGRIILGFGEFAALGALSGVVGAALLVSLAISTPASGLIVAFAVAVIVCALHGIAMGRFVLRPLARASGQQVLIATIGLAIALSEYLRLSQGAQLRWLPPVANAPWGVARASGFVVTVTPANLAFGVLGIVGAAGLVVLIRSTSYGRAWRAVSDDPRTAALFGVDARAVHDVALILACAACGIAGVIVTAVYGGMGFAGGFTLGLKALVAAVLGGIGSVGGAALGGAFIAVFETAWSSLMPLEQRDMAVYALLAAVLIFRPGGFFGDGTPPPQRG